MEKLTLKTGRYLMSRSGSTEERLRVTESYLAALTQELEHLLEELNGVLGRMETGVAQASAEEVSS